MLDGSYFLYHADMGQSNAITQPDDRSKSLPDVQVYTMMIAFHSASTQSRSLSHRLFVLLGLATLGLRGTTELLRTVLALLACECLVSRE
jgi:hypothetical protein